MKEKTTIRYIGFRSAKDGGRTFDFAVSATGQDTVPVSVEIPHALLEGVDRIHVQEGVGISYEKLKQLCELGLLPDSRVRLTAADLAQHKQASPASSKRRFGMRV